jgi:hypothetical protein
MNLPDNKTLRQYVVEYALASLAAAVVYLFHLYVNMNEKIIVQQQQQLQESQKVISNNTQALEENSRTLYLFKTVNK